MFDNMEHAIEKKRLEALKKYDVLDTDAEQIYDDLTKLASHICDMPISLVSLVDHHRQWFKSKVGIDTTETSRDIAFCAHAIQQDDLFVVKDATKDPRFSQNPLVTSAPNIRFYAGAPLKTPNGSKVGTLCVIDKKPRELTSEQEEALTILARQVVENFEIRLANRRLEKEAELVEELLETCESKDNILYTLTHDLKGSLSSILGLSELLMENIPEGSDGDVFKMAENVHQSGEASVKLLEAVLQWSINQGKLSSFLPVEMNMSEVIGEVLEVVKPNFQQKAHDFVVDCPEELKVKGDKHMIFSILQNLLSNACKYTLEKGTISIKVESGQKAALIRVIDTGMGMNREQLKFIINGARATPTRGTGGEKKGSGFGLMLCRQFIEKHNGHFDVKSEEGKGTEISFTIPLG